MAQSLTASELNDMLARGQNPQLIDVRTGMEYAEGHIPGSINIPIREFASSAPTLDRSRPVVLICLSGHRTEMLMRMLGDQAKGMTMLFGGTSGWAAEGLPMEQTAPPRMALIRQAQLVAGAMALGGTAMWMTGQNGMILTGLVGFGLMLAGVTGHCPMAQMLALMPWNQGRAEAPTCCTPKTASR